MERQIRWTTPQANGLEHLRLRSDGDIYAESVVIGGDNEEQVRWALIYTVMCDANWRTRHVSIAEYAHGYRLDLSTDGDGIWRDMHGELLPGLAGCIDVDIRATPFTNTLPMRRLHWERGESVEIAVVFVPMPDLVPCKRIQRYTSLAPGQWRFEALDSGFTAVLTTDADALVVEYPGLFRQVPEP